MRTFAVDVKWAGDAKYMRLVGLHGLHAERRLQGEDDYEQPPVNSFREQLRAAEDCDYDLLVGDFNKVPCCRQREPGYTLDEADRALRRAAGWTCHCCGGGGERESSGRMVPLIMGPGPVGAIVPLIRAFGGAVP